MSRSAAILLPIVAWLMLAGCSSITEPTLTVTGPRVIEATEDGRVLVFDLKAENPNSEELPLMDVEYRATAGGRTLFEGRRSAQASAPRGETSTIRIPVPVPAATPIEGPVRLTGTLTYRRSGRLSKTFADFGLHRRDSFSHTGEMPIED